MLRGRIRRLPIRDFRLAKRVFVDLSLALLRKGGTRHQASSTVVVQTQLISERVGRTG
jgi:hypothetical protein